MPRRTTRRRIGVPDASRRLPMNEEDLAGLPSFRVIRVSTEAQDYRGGPVAVIDISISAVIPCRQDAKNICVVGETGLLAANPAIVFRPGDKTADLVWPGRRAVASLFGAYTPQDPERLRGPQHCLVWSEEFAAWRFMESTWQMARLGRRLGPRPHADFTTTPRPAKTLVALMDDPHAVVTRASTSDNPHLPKSAVDELTRLYANSRIGQQELYANGCEVRPCDSGNRN